MDPLAPQTPPAHQRIVRVGTQYNPDTHAADRQGEEARQRICLPAVQIYPWSKTCSHRATAH